MIPASSASSFEHVTLEDAAPPQRAEADQVAAEMEDVALEGEPAAANRTAGTAAPAAASAALVEQASGASQAAGGRTDGTAAAGAAPVQPKSKAQPPPPATQALASVLGFFSAGTGSSGGSGNQEEQAGARGAGADGSAAAPAGEAAQQAGQGELDAVEAFEREALEAADKVAHAAEEVGQKLLHGAAEAKESLASLVGGISSWWATLDPTQPSDAPSADARGGSSAAAPRAAPPSDVAAAAEALGLEGGETVLESFGCVLWQTYTSTNNFFTPVRQVPFPGSLHVTSRRLCFAFEDRGLAPIKLPGKAIKGAAKAAADAAHGLPERLELVLEGKGQSLVLGGFALGAMELDSALALVEHLAEDCAA
ncbi:hypothetical protein ABPG77_004316 [Micractinium sp. CCAP 211/92]